MAAELNGGNLLCICTLTHACACFGGWSGAIEPGCRDNNGIPPARRTPDGVLASCINGIFDDALSLDNISSRSICLNRKLFVKSDRCNLKNENWRRNKKTEEKTRKKNKLTNLLVLLLVQQTAGDLCVCVKIFLPEISMNVFVMIRMTLSAVYHWLGSCQVFELPNMHYRYSHLMEVVAFCMVGLLSSMQILTIILSMRPLILMTDSPMSYRYLKVLLSRIQLITK